MENLTQKREKLWKIWDNNRKRNYGRLENKNKKLLEIWDNKKTET